MTKGKRSEKIAEEMRKLEEEEAKRTPEEKRRRKELGFYSLEELKRNAELGLDEEEEEDEEDSPEQKALWKKEDEEMQIRELKIRNLKTIEKQLEESEKANVQQTKLSQFWQAVLENPNWEKILRYYFSVIHAMPKMCSKTVITVREKDGKIEIVYEFFDKDGRPVLTEYNDGAKEALEEGDQQ
jgi:hypothetical protein